MAGTLRRNNPMRSQSAPRPATPAGGGVMGQSPSPAAPKPEAPSPRPATAAGAPGGNMAAQTSDGPPGGTQIPPPPSPTGIPPLPPGVTMDSSTQWVGSLPPPPGFPGTVASGTPTASPSMAPGGGLGNLMANPSPAPRPPVSAAPGSIGGGLEKLVAPRPAVSAAIERPAVPLGQAPQRPTGTMTGLNPGGGVASTGVPMTPQQINGALPALSAPSPASAPGRLSLQDLATVANNSVGGNQPLSLPGLATVANNTAQSGGSGLSSFPGGPALVGGGGPAQVYNGPVTPTGPAMSIGQLGSLGTGLQNALQGLGRLMPQRPSFQMGNASRRGNNRY